jgi:deoxyribodipyrimidine photo-lyase
MSTCIYRFARDLRLDDHAGLAAAAAIGEIVPALIVDRALEARLAACPRRAAFFCAAVQGLDDALRQRGTRLVVRRGPVSGALLALARECDARGVAWSASYDATGAEADSQVQSELEEAGLSAAIVHDAPAIPPDETTSARAGAGNGYRAFVPYLTVWRELTPHSYEAPLLLQFAAAEPPTDALPKAADFGAPDGAVESGARGQDRLETFLRGPALQYAVASNVPAEDSTSHLSAHLAFGTIAARAVVRAVRERSNDPFLLVEERASLRLFLRSIAARDFFLQLAWYHGRTDEAPLQEKMRGFDVRTSHPALEAWREGRTGYPLVDAGIRQLHATGWMHPRVRSVAASFLCFDLGVDWRIGRAEWERYTVDDDPAIATGNWQWIAGVGADMAQYPRIFNPEKQRHRFDPTGAYVKRWVGELARATSMPGATRAANAQTELPLFDESAYPLPVVNHERAAREFLARYREFVGTRSL